MIVIINHLLFIRRWRCYGCAVIINGGKPLIIMESENLVFPFPHPMKIPGWNFHRISISQSIKPQTRFNGIDRINDAMSCSRRNVMGKYFIGWLLGVPVFVLLIIYFVMN